MARSILSLGMLAAFALRTTVLKRGFMSGSPPPCRAVMLSSLISLVNIWPRFASATPFLCLIVCHLLWPDMVPLLLMKFELRYHKRKSGVKAATVPSGIHGGHCTQWHSRRPGYGEAMSLGIRQALGDIAQQSVQQEQARVAQ